MISTSAHNFGFSAKIQKHSTTMAIKKGIVSPTFSIKDSVSKYIQTLPADLFSATLECQDMSACSKSTTPLPLDFELTPFTVIVGRGRLPKQNSGNKHLRSCAKSCLGEYSNATDKRTKSMVVSTVFSMMRDANPAAAAFVKRGKKGRWFEVNDSVAREKIGYTFRDLLCDRYRSSSKSKVARHRSLKERPREGLDSIKMEHAMRLACSVVEADMIPTKLQALQNITVVGDPLDTMVFHPIETNEQDNKVARRSLKERPREGLDSIKMEHAMPLACSVVEADMIPTKLQALQNISVVGVPLDTMVFHPIETNEQDNDLDDLIDLMKAPLLFF